MGEIRYKSYLIINQAKSKVKVDIFHIFLSASGEGSTQAVSLTAFSQFFFTPSLIATVPLKSGYLKDIGIVQTIYYILYYI